MDYNSTIYRGNHTGSSASPPSVLEMALALAADGLPVFPCKADKKPIFKGGFRLASTNPAVIRNAFGHPQAKLIGVPTGPASGFDILDLDPRKGSDAWKAANLHLLPETRIHRTPGLPKKPGDPVMPGEHYVFGHVPSVVNDNSGRIGPGVDVRGEGGYAIFPPSDGYRVISDADIANWHPELLALVLKPPKPAASERPTAKPKLQPDQLLDKRLQALVDKLLGNVRRAAEGAKHHTLLVNARTLGGIMNAAGISEADAVKWLLEALPNTVADWKNAEKTALDGLRDGQKSPIEMEDRPKPNGHRKPPPPPPEAEEEAKAKPPLETDGVSQSEPPPLDADWVPDAKPASPVEALIAEFNARYMVVNEAGKALIYEEAFDQALRRHRYDKITFDDFKYLYMNRRIRVGVDDKGNPVRIRVADVWLNSPDRRQFIHGVTFDPSGREQPGILNLWRGFGVEARQGDWSLLKNHIQTVVCKKDELKYSYLMGWMARLVQHPAEQGEVAVVMQGGRGAGKGILARVLLRIIGQHGVAISNAKHLIGNFNGHLRDCVYLFADEVFFAGDRAHVGVLNNIITEPHLMVEAKHRNAVQTPNFLHLIMASNEEWVVPAALDERRFFVLPVSNERQGDHAYFGAIMEQLERGGYEAMLHELLNLDISGFNVRGVPVTEGLQEQKKRSLPAQHRWWMDCLMRSYVFRSKLGLEEHFGAWREAVSTELLYASYLEFAARERRTLSREEFGQFMGTMSEKKGRLRSRPVGEHWTDVTDEWGNKSRRAVPIFHPRPPGYVLGTLAAARERFQTTTKLPVDWGDEMEEEF